MNVEHLASTLSSLRAEIGAAAAHSGRTPDVVRLIGVTKTITPAGLPQLRSVGLDDFAENRWQHARDLLEHPAAVDATWHFIGHLQMNKVKYIVRSFSYVHSVDSVELATAISRLSEAAGKRMNILLQVNVSGEAQKFGLPPSAVAAVAEAVRDLPGIRLCGLMTMAPHAAEESVLREVFGGLRALRDDLLRAGHLPESATELSMGMSDDFRVAIEEGATMVRIGRRLMQAVTVDREVPEKE
ncbi:YggS family pyridoxal phosphate enzyme [Alicyclobacillus contaminans]|uniref:YggS family pyridoxal phosphate-dependent enzyme n=1 Tax=Alicyclobacillus contaminans TaxID=392016 RepID=UPI0003FA2636|nr:YggS family pyridoxal phosphate-dependent enzyme [Alicyclobacillus contaminans]GMA49149.1 YggS family pyridoxal phosphate enzyme [Alicyclobacillus contaminans]